RFDEDGARGTYSAVMPDGTESRLTTMRAGPGHIIAMLRREDLIVAYNSKLIAMRKEASEEAGTP
ncbi:MAG: hypothetical protein R3236_10560, partial [Phycisphaeraceae bacterium]|nr:hypothetical protein [Phycisphaeraceae bacterium]